MCLYQFETSLVYRDSSRIEDPGSKQRQNTKPGAFNDGYFITYFNKYSYNQDDHLFSFLKKLVFLLSK